MNDLRAEILSTLKKVTIFAGLSEQQFGFVAARVVERRFPAGELVFSEGDTCKGLFIVHKGAVRVFKNSTSGREQTLTIEGVGGAIAELPVFDGGPYPASAQVVTDATLLFFSKQDFRAMCLQDPEVTLAVLANVGARLRNLVGIIEELSFTTVRHRLAAMLVRMAKSEGTKTAAGVQILLPPTNQDIAAQIGTVRELVSRNLSRFQSEGLLKLEGRTATIPAIARLADELQGDD